MNPDNDGAYEAVPMRCFACQARDKQSAKWARDDKSDTAGLMLGIVDSDDVKRG